MSGPRVLLTLSLVALALGAQSVPTAAAGDDDAYPADITPPAGTQYPCALTPLPRPLAGIPEAERGYVNRVYALVLKAIHAKLRVLKVVQDGDATLLERALERYRVETEGLAARIGVLPPPSGLEPFRDDVVGALALQRTFFVRAVEARRRGSAMDEVWRLPEGRQASQRLIAAWGRMQRRYPAWPRDTSESIYHHLCALDLF